jgi:hypothetical protein
MNIFQIINFILFKRSNITDLDVESQSSFFPYLINRWISFYSKTHAIFVNETLNKFSSLFEDKNEMFKLYNNLTPKVKFKRIEYIKKNKKDEKAKQDDDMMKLFARNNFLSKRELDMYVDLTNNLCK